MLAAIERRQRSARAITVRRQAQLSLARFERQIHCRAKRMLVTARVKRRAHRRRVAAPRDDRLMRQFVDQLTYEGRNQIEFPSRNSARRGQMANGHASPQSGA